ncbi:MAG TPA: SRPBCC family protein [Thermohalobaculum sp.]|nr:SRPBCC family protein [Thermohalobaculum sp.]
MSRHPATVTRSATVNAPMSEVWTLIGDFHGVDRWHPVVATCERATIGDDEFRVLTTADGARILEHLVAQDTHGYTYAIVRSPLPLAHYEARIEANTAGAGTEVTWSGSFTPTAEGAEDIVAGIYQAGLDALAERFGG